MKKDEELQILFGLDRLDDQMIAEPQAQPNVDHLIEQARRWQKAHAAFPDMTYPEFLARSGLKPKRGRPRLNRAHEPIFMAAHDFDRIRLHWPSVPRTKALEIAANRHSVDENDLDDAVRRGNDRRHDRRVRRP